MKQYKEYFTMSQKGELGDPGPEGKGKLDEYYWYKVEMINDKKSPDNIKFKILYRTKC